MTHRIARTCLIATVIGCASARRPSPSPAFAQGLWRIRIDVDSAPTRQLPKQPVFGTINFATGRYSIDLWKAISRPVANGASALAVPQSERNQPAVYKITLGDSGSFDDKLVFFGRAVTPDSLVGTWTETILCCSAGGRFTLWRVTSR